MIDTQYCQLMAEYNAWMNGKVYAAGTALPHSVLVEDQGAFFKSIYLTLNHIAYSDMAFTHFLNHQTHHRGQVTTLLSQRGIDVGSTDIPFMARFGSA